MKRFQTYRFRLKVSPRIDGLFRRFAGCCRYVYNRALAIQNERRSRGERMLTFAALCRELTKWRNDPETGWLANAPRHALENALDSVCFAFQMYFQHISSAPVFKKKGKAPDAFRETDAVTCFSVDSAGGRVRLPKVGWVSYFNSRPVEGAPKFVSVKRRQTGWFVSIITEREIPDPVHAHPESAVGVDVGVANLATISTGEHVPSANAHRGILKRARRLQRSLARKVKFSANWKKVKEKITRLHTRATNRRRDALHKLTTRLSKNHALIVVEDLKVSQMTRSAKGTVDKPGRKVRQKSALNRAICDQGWGALFNQLAYKSEWNGGRLVRVCAAFSSQKCSACGFIDAANRPTQDRFSCLWCGHTDHADVNAARNLLAVGQTATACGGDSTASEHSDASKPGETGIAPLVG